MPLSQEDLWEKISFTFQEKNSAVSEQLQPYKTRLFSKTDPLFDDVADQPNQLSANYDNAKPPLDTLSNYQFGYPECPDKQLHDAFSSDRGRVSAVCHQTLS